MRRLVIVFVSSLSVIFPANLSFADSSYYIELGNDMAPDEAAGQWSALASRYKSQLGKLTYYPKTVMQGGTAVATRIQAGPIATKSQAQKICTRLFSGRMPCFVIEGADNTPPASMANLSEKSEEGAKNAMLPWLAASGAEPSSGNAAAALPWLVSDASTEDKRAASVDVAEAIRVPLSTQQAPPVTVTVQPAPVPAEAPEVAPVTADNTNDSSTQGWLTIARFNDDMAASSFWQEVRQNDPAHTTKVRVRIVRPLLTQSRAGTSIKVGPFANRAQGEAFCQQTVHASEIGLSCYFNEDAQENTAANVKVPQPFRHADAYIARRQAVAAQHPNRTDDIMAPTRAAKTYWAQIVAAPSEMDALKAWEKVRTDNADILEGLRSSVAASLTGRNSYVVRVGPLPDSKTSATLCASLKNRGVDCRVIQYSGM